MYFLQADTGMDDSSPSHSQMHFSPSSSSITSMSSYRGEIIVAMKFVPPPSAATASKSARTGSGGSGGSSSSRRARGMLMVLIKEAKNLVPATKVQSNADPFCKW